MKCFLERVEMHLKQHLDHHGTLTVSDEILYGRLAATEAPSL